MRSLMQTFTLALFLPYLGYGQVIIDVTADVSSQPNTFQIYGAIVPGFISAIDIDLTEQEGDTTEIRMYFKGCSANSIWNYFDTSITVESIFPYDLMIFTYRDTNTVTTGPQPCFLTNLNIIPVDTFYLSAAQILSTRESRRAPSFQVYPNPVADRLYFDAGSLWHTAAVYSTNGNRVMEVQQAANGGQIPVGHLPSGVYMMVLHGRDGEVVGKARFVKSP